MARLHAPDVLATAQSELTGCVCYLVAPWHSSISWARLRMCGALPPVVVDELLCRAATCSAVLCYRAVARVQAQPATHILAGLVTCTVAGSIPVSHAKVAVACTSHLNCHTPQSLTGVCCTY